MKYKTGMKDYEQRIDDAYNNGYEQGFYDGSDSKS